MPNPKYVKPNLEDALAKLPCAALQASTADSCATGEEAPIGTTDLNTSGGSHASIETATTLPYGEGDSQIDDLSAPGSPVSGLLKRQNAMGFSQSRFVNDCA